MKQKILTTILKSMQKLKDPYYQGCAAELGFYFIFSIIPILTLMLQALSIFNFSEELFNSIYKTFGDNEMVVSVLTTVSESVKNGSASIVFIVVALWSASKLEFSMIRMADYTYHLQEKQGLFSQFVMSRVRAIITVSVLILMIVLSLIVLVYGSVLLELGAGLLNKFLGLGIDISAVDSAFRLIRWPVSLVVYVFLLALNYMMIPDKKMTVRAVLPGSLFAAVAIIVVTLVYNIYFEYFSNFNLIYGSLAVLIALLLWFYLVSYIFMLGMVFNACWTQDE